jgi:hypothetical protein
VNKGLGKGLASAIETGETAGRKVKDTVGTSVSSLLFFCMVSALMSFSFFTCNLAVGTSKEVKAKTEQTASSAAQKGNQAAAQAREKKDEMLEKGKSQ